MIEEQEGIDQALESAMPGLESIQKQALDMISRRQMMILRAILAGEPSCENDWFDIAQLALTMAFFPTRPKITIEYPAEVHKLDLHFTMKSI